MHVNTVHPEMAARWGELERKLPAMEYFGSGRLGVSRTGTGQQSGGLLRTGSGNHQQGDEEENDGGVEEEGKGDGQVEGESASAEDTSEHLFTISPYQEEGGQDKKDSVYPPLCE